MECTIYYNPSCSKCRSARSLAEERGAQVRLRDYLADPPSVEEIEDLLSLLGAGPRDIIRAGEPDYARLALADASDDELIEAMSRHPILIQRPIVIANGKAFVGRPPERILALFDDSGAS